MTFFRKSWESDISAVYSTGIIFGYIFLIFCPLPQLFSVSTGAGSLLYTCAAGMIFLVFSCLMMHLDRRDAALEKVIGISLPDKNEIKESCILLCGLLPAIWAITWHWKFTMRKLEIPFADKQDLLGLVDFSNPLQITLLVLMSAVIMPFVEELVFRRVLYGVLAKSGNFNAAGFITSGIFSAAHGYLAGAPGLFLGGIAFQWLYSRHRNLGSAIFIHSLFNTVSLMFVIIEKTFAV